MYSDQSLASSVNRYRYENGRRYHGYRDGPHAYYAPNDDSYVNYESIVHHLWLLTLEDKLFLAPLENPQMVLDIGTGVGLWAIDMADCFPGAEIIGTDLSSIQSTTAPPNIRFEYDDANSEWTYPENSFDFVHVRGLTGCIRDWLALYQQAYKTLKPGAWFQHGEFSITTNADPKSDVHADKMYTKFSTLTMSCGEEEHTGMTFYTVERMRGYMEDAGFTNIVEKKFIWPIGPWPKDPHLKEMGRWGERNWTDGIENWVLALYTRFLGWKYTEVQSFITEFRKVIKDRKNHYYQTVCVVYGRKPGLEGKLGIEENLSLEATLKFEGGRSEGREGDEGDEEKAGE
ncbi:S-adenosyl-L-methionine-dependent methyltransferase [Sporormia fimetaria CBS 119925]|uniref:S-adenosyl-L-methionine-dependent methyltransferase n=1 Tax=Sporormia fimetaria CBS 119925 TaxID=1340428 RepID=A0A6A6VG33_9PLEO|nr:S-adenosyl-L-methionine-dependent methyltransferase [Sporormia fimetaria CBS 119925]